MKADQGKNDPFSATTEDMGKKPSQNFVEKPNSIEHNDVQALRAQANQIQSKNKKLKSDDRKLAKSIEEAERERLAQANGLRPWFMGVSLFLAAVVVGASAFTMVKLTLTDNLTDPIGVGFIVSLAIEVIGIIAIIAHYLFSTPDSKLLDQKRDD